MTDISPHIVLRSSLEMSLSPNLISLSHITVFSTFQIIYMVTHIKYLKHLITQTSLLDLTNDTERSNQTVRQVCSRRTLYSFFFFIDFQIYGQVKFSLFTQKNNRNRIIFQIKCHLNQISNILQNFDCCNCVH